MAIDKAVDSAKLDAALVATADAIRAKGGGTAKLAWKETNGFADEIDTLPEAVPEVTQATPSITVSSGGLITASATQAAGKVAAGTKSATKQLTTQGAKTVTPTASDQTAVASGRYTTGAVTVKGDANLVAANIVKGKTIFGVAGNAETAGTESVVAGTITRASTTQIVISGLSFLKIKAVYLAARAFSTNSGDINQVSLIMQGGKQWAYTYLSNQYVNGIASSSGSTSRRYSYDNGTLTITTGSYDVFSANNWLYAIIGE